MPASEARRTFLGGLVLIALGALPAVAQPSSSESAGARLVVLLVIDQFPSWLYEEARPYLGAAGFLKLERDGVLFTACAYRHSCTVTGPGHATIGTGALAADHGIVGNSWFDRTLKKKVYCCDDEAARLLGGSAGGYGRSPKLLLAPTLGDTLKAHRTGACKSIGISWKDRSAILMVGKSADHALWVEDGTGQFQSSAWYGEDLPSWVKSLNASRPFDAYFGKSWERTGPDAAFAGLVDDQPFEVAAPGGSRRLPRKMTGGGTTISASYYAQLGTSPFANEVLVAAAKRAIVELKLGQDDDPDILGLSLSANDLVGHNFGSRSVEVRDMMLRTDVLVGDLLAFLEKTVGKDRTILALTSDHGSSPVPEMLKPLRIPAGRGTVALKAAIAAQKALIEWLGSPAESAPQYVTGYDDNALFLDRAVIEKTGRSFADAAELAAKAAAEVPGIARAIPTSQVLQFPTAEDRLLRSLRATACTPRVGDVMTVLAPYWLDSTSATSHGSPWPYDQEVPLLVMGPGLKKGHRSSAPVTPGAAVVIAARLLGLPRPALAFDEAPPDAFVTR